MAVSLMQDPSGGSSLKVIEAVKEGWGAFARAPWVFIGFTLLAGVLSSVCSLIQGQVDPDEAAAVTAVDMVRLVVGSILSVLVSLWSTTGLVRGAWSALSGGKPALGTFTRWDGAASWRLFRNGLALGILMIAILMVAALVGVAAAQLNQILAVLPFLAAFTVLIYLAVNQKFLAQIALLEGRGPIDSITRGRTLLDPQWGSVLLLALVEFAIVLVGLLACFVGLLVAVPVVLCTSTAAYRQVFGSEDLTGLLAEPAA
ncbi:hypothetical protein [Aphanothece minutissima]|uniref:DUF975 domain-containing protein n=1 Tax=Aphanothece cf. minutissima CCALA 015 TaxID=2107695 RepID=A0ABX5F955_9CHRO|nr:hypothetical protein [Aphanothece minutissima]PSB38263.1 hypothetical protein C7B81_06070 [Aphanothece cf. minutissima CCALA 015]